MMAAVSHAGFECRRIDNVSFPGGEMHSPSKPKMAKNAQIEPELLSNTSFTNRHQATANHTKSRALQM